MSKESQPIKKYIWGSIIIAIIIGVLMIGFISGYTQLLNQTFFTVFGSGILIAGASFSGGGFLGFLFGIPSILQNPTAKLKYNDNLVQISDWLTKIIVGVGLTQIYNIPRFIKKIGVEFQINFGGGTWAINAAVSIISYFFLLGFLMMYFWSKTDYSTIMKEMDDDINQVKEENIKIKQENDSIKGKVVETKTKENIKSNELTSDVNSLHTIVNNPTLKDEFEKLQENVKSALKNKPVTVPDDLQKSRWGGKAIDNGKIIKAEVTPNKWQNFYDVIIEISLLKGDPLNLPVAIFVHDSYKLPDNVIYLMPTEKGVIKQNLIAYEAFTIGALVSDGTELELDLNEQSGYPPDFYTGKST